MTHDCNRDGQPALPPAPGSARFIEIERCSECKHFNTFRDGGECLLSGREIDDLWYIPSWCKLPVAPNTQAQRPPTSD